METIRFKNRFRIVYKGKVLSLNTVTNVKGYSQFTSSFTTLNEAITTRRAYALIRGIDEQDMEIQPYSEQHRHFVPHFSKEANAYFEKTKTFSGRGLRFKGFESSKDSKYRPDKFYGHDVAFAQSVERNKGLSTIAHLKDKRKTSPVDYETFEKIKRIKSGTFNLGESLIVSLRKRGLGKKALRRYLRSNGYSVAQAITITSKVFDPECV